MDKETLSNYGWIVICVLVIAIMVALATPFGNYVKSAVENTTQGMFDVEQKALETGGLTIAGQSFGGSGGGSSTSAYNHDNPALHPAGTVPEGGYFCVPAVYGGKWETELISEEIICTAGSAFPSSMPDWTTYQYGDYTYTYSSGGWSVNINTNVTDKNQTSYGSILESINGVPITDMQYTFHGCTSLTTAPVIPNGVTDLYYTFGNCESLKTYIGSTDPDGDFSHYVIPSGVTNMPDTFIYCTALTKAPVIPESVTNMGSAFYNCTSLITATEIPNNVTKAQTIFYGCTGLVGQNIVIPHDCDMNGNNNGLGGNSGTFKNGPTWTRVAG